MVNPIDAGKLTTPVTVLRNAGSGLNGHGEEVEDWRPAADLPNPLMAEVVFSTGRERFESAEKAASAPALFRFRWIAEGPLVTDRLRVDGRDYEISSSVPIGRRDGREVIAAARGE